MKLLRPLGARTLSHYEFCRAIALDLENKNSIMKSDQTSFDWHTKVSEKLLAITDTHPSRTKALKCIPLQDGSWVPASVEDICAPEYDRILVPSDLGCNLIRREVWSNSARRELFYALGASDPEPELVNVAILKQYNGRPVNLESSVSHLRWLYNFLPQKQRDLDRRVPIFASDDVPTYRFFVPLGRELRVGDLYFETDGEFRRKNFVTRGGPWSQRAK